MKYLLFIPFYLYLFSTSQEIENSFELQYRAQTRGFNYELKVKDNKLYRNIHKHDTTINLNEAQTAEIIQTLYEIDFASIENNINQEKLNVDAAIQGNLKIQFRKKHYEFEFDHNNLPDPIFKLFKKLESFE